MDTMSDRKFDILMQAATEIGDDGHIAVEWPRCGGRLVE